MATSVIYDFFDKNLWIRFSWSSYRSSNVYADVDTCIINYYRSCLISSVTFTQHYKRLDDPVMESVLAINAFIYLPIKISQ